MLYTSSITLFTLQIQQLHTMKSQTLHPRHSVLSTIVVALAALTFSSHKTSAFSFQPIPSTRNTHFKQTIQISSLHHSNDISTQHVSKPLLATLAALSILALPLTNPLVNAYEESDYASETVTNVVTSLKSNAGDVDGTFTTLEEIAKIITEGKGVGGSLSYG